MALGYIGFSQNGNVQQTSPSVWADCLNTIFNDKDLGNYFHQDFLGDYATPAATTTAPGIQFTATGTSVFTSASAATYGPNVLSGATGASDNDHYQLRGEEMIQIVRNSGKKAWFEVRFAVGALNDSAFFVGLTTKANAVVAAGPIADNPTTGAAALTAATVVGFVSVQAAAAIGTVNAVYSKATATPVTVLADVTNASAFVASQANLPTGSVITQAQGVTAQGVGDVGEGLVTATGNLVANAFRKFGIRFDGYTKLEFYVDGVLVARQEVDSTVDQTSFLVPVVAVKTGTAAATTDYVDWVQAAYQIRG